MKDQLIKIMTHFNITASRFADEIGVQRSSISHILSGRNKPSYDFILRVIEKYPSLDPSWILTGKGNMILVESDNRKLNDEVRIQESELFMPDKKPDSDNSPQPKKEIKQNVDIRKQSNEVTKVNNLISVILLYSDGTFFRYTNRDNNEGREYSQ
jgi:plasmid maintenance system antidote protein VapI